MKVLFSCFDIDENSFTGTSVWIFIMLPASYLAGDVVWSQKRIFSLNLVYCSCSIVLNSPQ